MLLKAACKSGALERFSVRFLDFGFYSRNLFLHLAFTYQFDWLLKNNAKTEVTNKITTAVYYHYSKLQNVICPLDTFS